MEYRYTRSPMKKKRLKEEVGAIFSKTSTALYTFALNGSLLCAFVTGSLLCQPPLTEAAAPTVDVAGIVVPSADRRVNIGT